jgi:uncharacterized protein (DUF362 family)
MLMNQTVYQIDFTNYKESVPIILSNLDLNTVLNGKSKLLIKPNLVDAIPFPVTTHVECVEAIIDYIRSISTIEIIVGEGVGSSKTSLEVFDKLGYSAMARKKDVPLIDLNNLPLVKLSNPGFKVFPNYFIPEIALESVIFSAPVLKAHSFAKVSLTLKNMMGFAPPAHYQVGGHWKKSFFHSNMQTSLLEMSAYRAPDITLLDASMGMAEYHLGGATCNPPIKKLVAGFEPDEVDKAGASLLGFNWNSIAHIARYKEYSTRIILNKESE